MRDHCRQGREVIASDYPFRAMEKFPSSHAAAVCELMDGDLLAAWYAGQREGDPDSVIMGARFSQEKKLWEPPQVWVDVHGHAAGNPRLFTGPDELVWLLAPINYGAWCQGGTELYLKRSADGGRSWTDLERFIRKKGVLGKNKPVSIGKGIWIIPAEYERSWEAVMIRSEDNGEHWDLVPVPAGGERLHQPAIVQLSDGSLLAYLRTWEGYIYQTRSEDSGQTWSRVGRTNLPNNNSGIDMIRLRSGKLLLVYNPVHLGPNGDLVVPEEVSRSLPRSEEMLCNADSAQIDYLVEQQWEGRPAGAGYYPNWGPRTPLSIAVSGDEGNTWERVLDLETDPGEFSYPAVIQDELGTIHIVYTCHRTNIKHVRLIEGDLGR